MKSLLKNAELQEHLNVDGYITMPFLNEEELESARTFYDEIHPTGEAPGKIEGIHMTTWCSDYDYKMKVANFLDGLYKRACDENFKDFRRLNNVFIVKETGNGTTFKVHQDWNVVDEKDDFAINVWVPLYDVDETSGALWTVKGSHQIDRHVRGSAYLFPDYSPFYDDLEKVAKSVNLKAGHAIIFYLNVIHGSPPNLGERERIATCFSVIPENAHLSIYFQKQAGDQLEVHEPADDFMFKYDHLRTETLVKPPSEKPVKILPTFVNTPVTREELNFCLGAEKKIPWYKRVF
ncbi:MAG: phytanoyl-CoA dioxygenase family protein [Crocinitomicaceae bacterium]|nr:phytanoyl-CoA dioxygenase family protein [Crocinitomicaceae bacterium]